VLRGMEFGVRAYGSCGTTTASGAYQPNGTIINTDQVRSVGSRPKRRSPMVASTRRHSNEKLSQICAPHPGNDARVSGLSSRLGAFRFIYARYCARFVRAFPASNLLFSDDFVRENSSVHLRVKHANDIIFRIIQTNTTKSMTFVPRTLCVETSKNALRGFVGALP
jgi:hypothetical protein